MNLIGTTVIYMGDLDKKIDKNSIFTNDIKTPEKEWYYN
jgi:hypothetical protein